MILQYAQYLTLSHKRVIHFHMSLKQNEAMNTCPIWLWEVDDLLVTLFWFMFICNCSAVWRKKKQLIKQSCGCFEKNPPFSIYKNMQTYCTTQILKNIWNFVNRLFSTGCSVYAGLQCSAVSLAINYVSLPCLRAFVLQVVQTQTLKVTLNTPGSTSFSHPVKIRGHFFIHSLYCWWAKAISSCLCKCDSQSKGQAHVTIESTVL